MFERFSELLGKLALVLNGNRYIGAIKDSFIQIIPFTIVGSIGTLLGSVVFSANGLGGMNGMEFVLDWAPMFNQLNYATMNILALLIAYNMGKIWEKALAMRVLMRECCP